MCLAELLSAEVIVFPVQLLKSGAYYKCELITQTEYLIISVVVNHSLSSCSPVKHKPIQKLTVGMSLSCNLVNVYTLHIYSWTVSVS